MSNPKWWQFIGRREFATRAREQALAFERLRSPVPQLAAAVALEEIIAAVADPTLRAIIVAAGKAFAVKRELEFLHKVIAGGTGSGKSTYVRLLTTTLVSEAAERAARGLHGARDMLDSLVPDIEVEIIDPKDDAPRFKKAFAAMFLAQSRAVQRVLRGSFLSIEVQRDRVTPVPLLQRHGDVSIEFLAQLKCNLIVVTSPADFSATMEALLFQLLRLLLHAFPHPPFDPITCHTILTNKAYRLTLLVRVPRDLAEYFGRLEENASPQTIAALLRRLLILLSFPEIRCMLGLPDNVVAAPKQRRITIADCGTTLLPPEIGLALANLLVTDVGLVAGTRDRRVQKVVFLDETGLVLTQRPALLSIFLNLLRVLRSSRTSFWFALQRLHSLPANAVEEILTNVGQVVAFQSRDDIAAILAPHLYVEPGDGRSDVQRRSAFTRDLATLPRREMVLWIKEQQAFRARVIDTPEPERASGVPERELLDIFDAELAPGSMLRLTEADRILDEWRHANLPSERITMSEEARVGGRKDVPSLRSIFGLEDAE